MHIVLLLVVVMFNPIVRVCMFSIFLSPSGGLLCTYSAPAYRLHAHSTMRSLTSLSQHLLLFRFHYYQVTHIDFGDCFEVAMHRERYPEKVRPLFCCMDVCRSFHSHVHVIQQVPFRLTRMMISAMEPCGVSGRFMANLGQVSARRWTSLGLFVPSVYAIYSIYSHHVSHCESL